MRILVIHNYYRKPGGEKLVFEGEVGLLRRFGEDVTTYTRDNAETENTGRVRMALRSIWNGETVREVRELVRRVRPDVAHIHNTLAVISPSVYHALDECDVPVVQSLHNYRLHCLPGEFFRDGRICEDCFGKPLAWPGVLHGCYRDDRSASAVVAVMLATHRILGTYRARVDRYIALTEFARRKFEEGGIPAAKIAVKPNFVDPDPGVGRGDGGFFLFVGRLEPNKGVPTLLEAWKRFANDREVDLVIAGRGSLEGEIRRAERTVPGLRYVGWQPRKDVLDLMKRARALVFPSEWYEPFGLVLVEALAVGSPVVASDLGGTSTMIEPGRTGLLFEPGNAGELVRCLDRMIENPEAVGRMRVEARAEFESRYTAEANYRRLMDIYRDAIESRERSAIRVSGEESTQHD